MKRLLFALTLLTNTHWVFGIPNLVIDTCPQKTSNLVVNGDFEQGYYGFTSDFGRGRNNATKSGCKTQGWIVVGSTDIASSTSCQNYPFLLSLLYGRPNSSTSNNPNDISNTSVVDASVCPYGYNDHTSGRGNYLAIDPDAILGRAYWKQTVTVCPYTDYTLSVWVRNITAVGVLPYPKFHFEVDGKSINAPVTYQKTSWQNTMSVWNSGTTTGNVLIRLVNDEAGCDGNDVAVDDIYFGACTSVDLTCDTLYKLCANQKSTLRLGAQNVGYSQPVFQWQKLDTVAALWKNITGATDSFYVVNINTTSQTSSTDNYRVVSAPKGGLNSACERQSKVIKIVVSPTPQIKPVVTNATCSTNNGAITLNISGGTLPYVVKWKNNLTNNALSSLSDGTYSVTITDRNNCMLSDSFKITKTFKPTFSTTIQPEICGKKNGAVTFVSNPRNLFNFNNGGIKQQTIFAGLSAGSYSVRIIDTAQCDSTFNVVVGDSSSVKNFKIVGVKDEKCHIKSGEVALSAESSNSLEFSLGGKIYGATSVFKNLPTGGYTFFVRDSTNCKDSINQFIKKYRRFSCSEHQHRCRILQF